MDSADASDASDVRVLAFGTHQTAQVILVDWRATKGWVEFSCCIRMADPPDLTHPGLCWMAEDRRRGHAGEAVVKRAME